MLEIFIKQKTLWGCLSIARLTMRWGTWHFWNFTKKLVILLQFLLKSKKKI